MYTSRLTGVILLSKTSPLLSVTLLKSSLNSPIFLLSEWGFSIDLLSIEGLVLLDISVNVGSGALVKFTSFNLFFGISSFIS